MLVSYPLPVPQLQHRRDHFSQPRKDTSPAVATTDAFLGGSPLHFVFDLSDTLVSDSSLSSHITHATEPVEIIHNS